MKKSTEWSEKYLLFWTLYPARWIKSSDQHVKLGRELAWREWQRLSEADQDWAMFSVRKLRPGEFIPDPWRWLRDKKFKDFDMTKSKAPMPADIKALTVGIGKPVPQPQSVNVQVRQMLGKL